MADQDEQEHGVEDMAPCWRSHAKKKPPKKEPFNAGEPVRLRLLNGDTADGLIDSVDNTSGRKYRLKTPDGNIKRDGAGNDLFDEDQFEKK